MLEPPKHLLRHGRQFFEQVITEYSIEDSAGIALLVTACECLDRMRQAQAQIKKHGVQVMDRYGSLKLNPACGLEKDSRNGFLAALRALNLDLEPLRDGPGRPGGK